MIVMNTKQEVNPAKAFFEGMLWAAFGVRSSVTMLRNGKLTLLRNMP